MKKTIALLLSLCLLLTACGAATDISSPSPVPDAPSPSATATIPPPAPAITMSSSAASESGSAVESASAAPVSAPAAAPKTWWQEGLARNKFVVPSPEAGCGGAVSRFYLYDDVNKLSHNASDCFGRGEKPDPSHNLDLSLITDSMQQADDIGSRIRPANFFEMVALDDTKYTGELYEKGILLTRSLPGQDKDTKNSVKLALNADDYSKLLANFDELLNDPEVWARPSWLTMMRLSRLTAVTVTGTDGTTQHSYRPNADAAYDNQFAWLLDDLQTNVNRTTVKPVTQTDLPDAAVAELHFNNDLVYRVYYTDKNILVTASGVDTAYLYEYSREYSSLNMINAYAKGFSNPRTGKPVIYLYPTKATDCTVTVDYPAFTYTYPSYGSGWNVTAYPDGRLVNKADNTEHYYLFWEGNKRIDWRFDSGFVVAGNDTESFLRQKLAYMGLTPREYNDFITYWVPKMQDTPYNLITFAGEQYEQLAPLTVTPAPDSILRVHMVYKPLQEPVTISEQTLRQFVRKGFTVVEWGGTTAD